MIHNRAKHIRFFRTVYLILYNNSAFYTNWFDAENNYVEGMIVFNLYSNRFTTDGKTWLKIEEDNL